MTLKPIDRLLFIQGDRCYFCKQALSKSEASVEHLVAKANGGGNDDGNCVVCCKSLNTLLGSLSLKEKIQIILNQKGDFKCPNREVTPKITPKTKPTTKPKSLSKSDHSNSLGEPFKLVLANLKQRGNSRPRTIKTLSSTIKSLFGNELSDADLQAILLQLQTTGLIEISGTRVSYSIQFA